MEFQLLDNFSVMAPLWFPHASHPPTHHAYAHIYTRPLTLLSTRTRTHTLTHSEVQKLVWIPAPPLQNLTHPPDMKSPPAKRLPDVSTRGGLKTMMPPS